MAFSLTSRQRAATAALMAAAALAGGFALGAGQGSAVASTPGASTGARITVTGTGNVSGTPSQLQLSMGVQTNGATVDGALAQANRAVRAVTRVLEASGVASSGIQTSGLSIQPNYSGNSPLPKGYGVSESITVTLRNLARAGGQITRAVHAGGDATLVNGVSLNLSDTSSLLASARVKAVADARAKAAAYAKALGRSLGPVVSMSEQSEPSPQGFPLAYAAANTSGRSVPISPGSQQLSVTVTVVFSLG